MSEATITEPPSIEELVDRCLHSVIVPSGRTVEIGMALLVAAPIGHEKMVLAEMDTLHHYRERLAHVDAGRVVLRTPDRRGFGVKGVHPHLLIIDDLTVTRQLMMEIPELLSRGDRVGWFLRRASEVRCARH